MKKIFTLISMALVAMSVNAQTLPEHCYPIKTITWGDITWKNGNNKKDKDDKNMLFLMGTGNGYKDIFAEEIYTDGEPTGKYRPYYTYIDYEKGETGTPGYGLYFKFTPSVAGKLKMNVWVNKGNRKTFVVKGSNGAPLVPYVDYTFDGYVNGQNQDGTSIPKYFTADEIKARHDAAKVDAGTGVDSAPYVIEAGNQAVWGWINFDVVAGETYVVYQQSSQLGFGGYEFTPAGGSAESYIACLDMGGTIMLNTEFSSIVDADGKATNVTDEGSVVTFGTTNMSVKAVGGAVPTEVTPNLDPSGISNVKAAEGANAPIFNLAGQKVDKSQKGILIQNGKKFVNK